ncbi:MAG: hypothetical protein ACI9HK_005635 [Pirellulaceae bacterium]|jgi:hypothetical protein
MVRACAETALNRHVKIEAVRIVDSRIELILDFDYRIESFRGVASGITELSPSCRFPSGKLCEHPNVSYFTCHAQNSPAETLSLRGSA